MEPRENLNDKKTIKILSIATILYINVLLIFIFAAYFRNKMNLTNPLIPKNLVDLSFEKYALKGLILSCGLPVLFLLKFWKKNFAVVVGSAVLALIYTFLE